MEILTLYATYVGQSIHVITLCACHQTVFFDKWNIDLCKKILYLKNVHGFMVLSTKFWGMFWAGILACQISHRKVPSKHAAAKPNSHFLKLETNWNKK